MAITKEQAVARRGFVGGSDAAAILGYNPWSDPWQVWAQKTGRAPEFEGDGRTRFGTRMEAVLLETAREDWNLNLVPCNDTFRHATLPHIACHPDAMLGSVARGSDIGEFKVSGLHDGWGEPGTDQVPDMVLIQCQFNMGCCDSELAHVGVCFPRRDYTPARYVVRRNNDLIVRMMDRLNDWFEKYVVGDTPPPPEDGMPRLSTLMNLRTEDTEPVNIDTETVQAWLDAKQRAAEADKAKESALASLLAKMDAQRVGARVARCDAGEFRLAVENAGTAYDLDALAQAEPGLVATYNAARERFAIKRTRNVPRWKPAKTR